MYIYYLNQLKIAEYNLTRMVQPIKKLSASANSRLRTLNYYHTGFCQAYSNFFRQTIISKNFDKIRKFDIY